HWAVGWVRYLMVRSDAPQAVRDEAQAIADDLASYPILCEDAFSELEYDEVCAAWDDLSVRERAELIKDFGNGVSIFAARRAELPHDNSGMLYDRLRSY
ncbi:MAG: hypothetical protein KGH96_23690, partial [Sphingomonadales bacterium]|nr:hypothetical protein [Sphingomonadales bacterium]